MSDDTPKPSDHAESVRFVYEQLQAQLRIQEDQRKTFVEKAVALLAAALLFGNLIAVEMPPPPPADPVHAFYIKAWVLYVLAGLSLLIAALAAIHSLWPRTYRHDPTPRILHESYRFQGIADSQSLLSGNLVNSYENNERVLAKVHRSLKVSFVSLTIGLVLLFVFALVRPTLPIDQSGIVQETAQ
jgi:hypothetical protein